MLRFFEILPGALTWLTLFLIVFLSWKFPIAASIFIIAFDVYWLLKTIYLSFHLRSTFKAMKENLRTDWQKRLRAEQGTSWNDIYHLVILPVYNEPYEVVRETFLSLLASNYPMDKFMVVLGVEERAGVKAHEVALKIQKEFESKFFKFLITAHPANLPGEMAGKGSNETWAARRAKEVLIDPLQIPYQNILTSVFDIDTQVPPEYFGRLTYVFLNTPDRLRAIYQPIPLFTNNIFQAPALARIVAFSATFWQMIQQARPEFMTTFSSQSVCFATLVDIGFWETDIVSEDSRIFWQCYLYYDGDFRVVPLSFPVSMDANVSSSFWRTMKNLYLQQRRWAWGVENVPYVLMAFRSDKKISRSKKWYWSFKKIEGFHSWATNSVMIFLLGWLPVALGGKIFNAMLISYSLPKVTRLIISLSMVGIASSAILSVVLLPPKPKWFRFWHYILYFFQWLFLPITLIVFGALPAIEAQTRLMLGGKCRLGFWVTPKSRRENKSQKK